MTMPSPARYRVKNRRCSLVGLLRDMGAARYATPTGETSSSDYARCAADSNTLIDQFLVAVESLLRSHAGFGQPFSAYWRIEHEDSPEAALDVDVIPTASLRILVVRPRW